MKRQFLTLALALGLGGAFIADAVPAKRGLREITQPDGTTVKASLVGDEHFHYYLSEDGLPLARENGGALKYVSLDKEGKLVYSEMAAEDAPRRTPAARGFVSGVDTDAVIEALYNRAATTGRLKAVPQNGMGLFSGNFPRTGDIPALVFLVEYQDVKFTHPNPAQYFGDMINKEGFNEYGGTGCAREYFIQQSGGKFRPQFDVFGPVTLPEKQAYYGGNAANGDDLAPEDMLVHAAKILDDQIDFAKYDLDNDGKVDNVFIFYAGQGEASYGSENTVWPHSWELSSAGKAFQLDGKTLSRYACTNEWEQNRPDGVGTFIHEFSHVMGLPDLYHTTNSGATFTPGEYSVMDYGPYNNNGCTPPNYSIYERNAMGWLEPELLDGAATISLEEIGSSNRGCIIQTEKNTEFFLIENRQLVGWDKYIPGHGMLIWHIDFVQTVFDRNVVNNTSSHQYVDIVEAGGTANSFNPTTLATYPWPGTRNKTAFTSTTSPAMKSWAGKAIDMPITDITESSNGIITFNVAGGFIELDTPEGLKGEGKDNGTALLSWDAVDMATGYRVSLYTKDSDGKPEHYALKDELVETNSCTAERLISEADYYFTVMAVAGSNKGDVSAEGSFTMPALAWDYIIPPTTAPTEITDDSFIANWTKVKGATAYLLTVETEVGEGEKINVADLGTDGVLGLPEGWVWSGSTNEVYGKNSYGYYGESAPALKFNVTGKSLTTEVFAHPISKISFWNRLAGSTTGSTLDIQGRASESDGWVSFYEHKPTTKATTTTITEIPETVRQIRFEYNKVNGNVALDDIHIVTLSSALKAMDEFTDKNVGDVDSYKVNVPGLASTTCYYSVKAINADGKESQSSERRIVAPEQNTGISGVTAEATGVSLNGLTASYTGEAGDGVRVFNAAGMLVAEAKADSFGAAEISLPGTGLYIVAVPSGAVKLLAK